MSSADGQSGGSKVMRLPGTVAEIEASPEGPQVLSLIHI